MVTNESAKKRLAAALDESRRIEKEIDLREQRKDQEAADRLVRELTDSRVAGQ